MSSTRTGVMVTDEAWDALFEPPKGKPRRQAVVRGLLWAAVYSMTILWFVAPYCPHGFLILLLVFPITVIQTVIQEKRIKEEKALMKEIDAWEMLEAMLDEES